MWGCIPEPGEGYVGRILTPHPGGWAALVLLIISDDFIWAAPRLTQGSSCGELILCLVEGIFFGG